MRTAVNIEYREFYDLPRMFIAVSEGQQYLFDGSFDNTLDDYPSEYNVYLMPALSSDELAGSWAALPQRAVRHLGRVRMDEVIFDPTERRHIDEEILGRFSKAHPRGKAI